MFSTEFSLTTWILPAGIYSFFNISFYPEELHFSLRLLPPPAFSTLFYDPLPQAGLLTAGSGRRTPLLPLEKYDKL